MQNTIDLTVLSLTIIITWSLENTEPWLLKLIYPITSHLPFEKLIIPQYMFLTIYYFVRKKNQGLKFYRNFYTWSYFLMGNLYKLRLKHPELFGPVLCATICFYAALIYHIQNYIFNRLLLLSILPPIWSMTILQLLLFEDWTTSNIWLNGPTQHLQDLQ